MCLLLLLASYGLCFTLMHRALFIQSPQFRAGGEPVTWLDRLLNCSFCTGTHTGWMTWLAGWVMTGTDWLKNLGLGTALTSFPLWVTAPITLVMWVLASASWCYGLDRLLIRLEGERQG